MIRFDNPPHLNELLTAWPFWYLATAYSKFPGGLDVAFHEASRAAALLVRDGVRVFCPIAHSHPIAKHGCLDALDHETWMAADEGFMLTAHGLIVLKMTGWDSSVGVAQEIDTFSRFKKPVLFMEWPQ